MVPINEILLKRKSIFSFSKQPIEQDKLMSLFEAASWAPSSMNTQPWRFIYATQEKPEEYERLFDCLLDGNKRWVINAPVLVLTIAETISPFKNTPNKYAWHDVGISTGMLMLQAVSLGLSIHPMGGFEPEKAKINLSIPTPFEPVAMIAIGYKGETIELPEDLYKRETADRTRKSLDLFVFRGKYPS